MSLSSAASTSWSTLTLGPSLRPSTTIVAWQRHQRYLCRVPLLGLSLDVSHVRFDDGFFERMAPPTPKAVKALERAAIANPDENRIVGLIRGGVWAN